MRIELEASGYAEIIIESWDEIDKLCELCGCENLFQVNDKVKGLGGGQTMTNEPTIDHTSKRLKYWKLWFRHPWVMFRLEIACIILGVEPKSLLEEGGII